MKSLPCCLECNQPISWGIHLFSKRIFGVPLCMTDQCRIEESGVDPRAVDLYLALKSKNIPLELSHFTGSKLVDMALPGKLYIEVSGFYQETFLHSLNESVDLPGSRVNKIPTIVIPVSALQHPKRFAHMVNEVSKACRLMMKPAGEFYMDFAPPLMAVQLQ